MTYILKIKHEDTLRRLLYEPRGEELSYARLESKIRDLFKLPVQTLIRITYNDTDGDLITMADDQDLVDALIVQSLNPLRLHVTLAKPRNSLYATSAAEISLSHAYNAGMSQLPTTMNDLSRARQGMRGLASSYGSSASGVQMPQYRITELVEMVTKCLMTDGNSIANKNAEVCFELDRNIVGQQISSEPTESGPVTLAPRVKVLPKSGRAGRATETCALPFGRGEAVEPINPRNDSSRVFHSCVKCDGCGMSPIAGPRFKSIRKHNYDLCQSCFKEFGIDVDYTRIDRPAHPPRHQHSLSRGRMRSPVSSANLQSGRSVSACSPFFSRPDPRNYSNSVHQVNDGVHERRLDARFVQDVTILDGTELLPGTRFTKIWRLHNSGTLSWPPHTKLVHVAGSELGNFFDVPLELSEDGLLPNEEVDASLDLIAPEKPGRYVSHWRLAAPAGPKFGHRVWVLIQVVSKVSSPPVEKKSNVAMSREDEKLESTPPLSLPLLQRTRDAFVKASHDRFLAQRQARLRNALSRTSPSYVDVEEPFSGLRIGDVESLTDTRDRHSTSAVAAEVEVEEAKISVDSDSSKAIPRTGLMEILSTTDVKDQYPVGTPTETEEQFSSTAVEDCTVANSDDALKSDYSSAFVKVVYPEGHPLEADAGEERAEHIGQADVVTVENSELGGGFSMVEMPGDTMSQSDKCASCEELDLPQADLSGTSNDKEGAEMLESASPERLSTKLEAMGFTDHELNVELLVKNELDLRRTLNDLVKASEWDPILEELKEMGFTDRPTNLRLMFENKGSVKRVVKDLVQMNKESVPAAPRVVKRME